MIELTDLDANANARLEAIVAAGGAGKAELERVEKDVEAKWVWNSAHAWRRRKASGSCRITSSSVFAQARTVINEAMATADTTRAKPAS